MTRRRPWRRACSSAKASDDRVFPPPVGTVSEYSPGGRTAAAWQACSTSALRRLTGVGSASAAFRVKCASSFGNRELSAGQSARPCAAPGSKNASASKKSASKSADASIRTHNPASAPLGIPVEGGGASKIERGGFAFIVRSRWDRSARRSLRPILPPSRIQSGSPE
jgi:hypothetical protein